MKKIAIAFSFLILHNFYTYSQVTIEEGVIMKNENDCRVEKMLGADDKYFYLLKYYANSSGKNYILEKYSIDNYKLEFSKLINIKDEKKSTFLDAFYTCGKIVVFRRYDDKKNERAKLFMQTIDEKGNLSADLVQIFDCSIALKYGVLAGGNELKEGFVNYVDFVIRISENKKNILLVAETSVVTQKTENKNFVKILDMENLTVKFEKELPNQYATTKISPWNYKIDNAGNLYFNFNYLNSDNKPQIAIGLLSKSSSSIIGVDINVDRLKHEIEDIDYEMVGGKLYCSVLYKNRVKEKEKTDLAPLFGVFGQTIDLSTFKSIKSDSLHFSSEIVKKISTGSSIYFRIYRIAAIKIIANNIYTVVEQTSHMRGAFVVFKYKSGGGIDWVKAVPRNYEIRSARNNNFFVYSDSQKLYLLYGEDKSVLKNKTVDNLTMDNCKKTNYKDADVVSVSLDENGRLNKNLVLKKGDMILQYKELLTNVPNSYFSPLDFNLITSVKDNSAIVYLKGKKGYKFGKLKFN